MDIDLESPTSFDGAQVNALIQRCPPLDTNSTYCNLLQCDHFASTSVIAKSAGEAIGFISAYLIPERPETLFIWQVAIDSRARGQGLASKMLDELLARPLLTGVKALETTITEDNEGSWALFNKLAHQRQAPLKKRKYYLCDQHFNGAHDSEWLVRIELANQ